MTQLADLDREELLALAQRFCPADGPELLRARLEAARRREDASYALWKKASDAAVADARAVKARIDAERFDEATKTMMASSKLSTRKAGDLWKAYQKAFKHREELGRQWARQA